MLNPCMAINIRISCCPHIATFREPPIDLDGSHCSREKVFSTESTAHRLIDTRVRTQFLSQANQWSSKLKPSFCRRQATRLTGPIYQYAIGTFNTCSRGSTHRSLADTDGGLQPWNIGFPHTTFWPSQPAVSNFHLRVPPGLRLFKPYQRFQGSSLRNLWPLRDLLTTRPSTVTYIYA
jgi:hypothetical protein